MEVIKAEVEVAKETYELLQGVAGFVASVKKALDDGFQPGTDIPVIISDALAQLVPAVQGAAGIKAEAVENKLAFGQALLLGGAEIVRKVV